MKKVLFSVATVLAILIFSLGASAFHSKGFNSGAVEKAVKSPYACSAYSDGSPRIKGDITGDGRVNFIDATLMNQMVLGFLAKPKNMCCIDMDSDARLTSSDVEKVNRIRLGLEPGAGTCSVRR